jgi:hypothetical protein
MLATFARSSLSDESAEMAIGVVARAVERRVAVTVISSIAGALAPLGSCATACPPSMGMQATISGLVTNFRVFIVDISSSLARLLEREPASYQRHNFTSIDFISLIYTQM